MSYASRTEAIRAIASFYPDVSSELARALSRSGVPMRQIDDVVSEAFAAVMTLDDSRLLPIDNMRAYVHSVARNLGVRAKKMSDIEVPTDDELLDRAEDDPGYLEVYRGVSRELSERAFVSLPPEDQQLLRLAVLDRKPMKEIADVLGLNVSAVTTRLSRARHSLRFAYVKEFIETAPPACGYDTVKLARIITNTASVRMQRDYSAHLRSCSECPRIEGAARDELRYGSALVVVIAFGAVAASVAMDTSDAEASGGTRTLIGIAGAFAVALLLLSAAVLYPGEEDTGAAYFVLGSGTSESLDISATPSSVEVPLPAPGHTTRWTVTVRSSNASTADLFLNVDPVTTTTANLALDITRNDGIVMTGKSIRELIGIVYVGQVAPERPATFEIAVTRELSDTDMNASAEVLTTFIGSLSTDPALAVGEVLPPTDSSPGDDQLAATGGALTELFLCGGAVLASMVGFALLRRRRPVRQLRE